MTPEELRAFEDEVKHLFEAGKILGPVHLAGGNEKELIEIFKDVKAGDWIFTTYRGHYHALLAGVPRERVMAEIVAGRSMNLSFVDYRFLSSAIVGGCLPMAVGVAEGIRRAKPVGEMVWCFVGDMAASLGIFSDSLKYAVGHDLPIRFVIEDNGLSCDSPTDECWGESGLSQEHKIVRYRYERMFPHVGTGNFVKFV